MTVPEYPKIVGHKVKTPSKEVLATEIAQTLGIAGPTMSNGSTVVSELLDRIYESVVGANGEGRVAYAKAAAILETLGLTYDPFWDTSEARGETGGSTVTARAYSRMRTALTGVPRCFVLNSTDAAVGTAWETDKERHYRYNDTVTGRRPLNDAGPGSLILFYNTSNHSRHPMTYSASARVHYISPGWSGPWDAELAAYEEFSRPVPSHMVHIDGRNSQHAITEITWEQYRSIVKAGTGRAPQPVDVAGGLDVGGDRVAARVTSLFPPATVVVTGDPVPPRRTDGELMAAPERAPFYELDVDNAGGMPVPRGGRSASDRARDKLVEERAVELATKHLDALGWRVTADRQKDGVGYDLEMTDDSRNLHVEIKGIKGSRMEFNLTSKEWWHARNDPDFVLAAVTDTLSLTKARVNLLSPLELVEADRVATQYRLAVRQ